MPSVSKKQHDTMMAAAHDPAFAQKVGIPHSVAVEYVNADAKRKGMADALQNHAWGAGEKR